MAHRVRSFLACAVLLGGCLDEGAGSLEAIEQAATVKPVVVGGNPTCASLGLGTHGVKFDPPDSGTLALGPVDTVTMSVDGVHVDWTATMGIDAVIVKGGPNANIYQYSPESLGDTLLQTPTNPNNGKPYGLSHVDFCYDWEVRVEKSASTSLKRRFTWGVEKTGSVEALTLASGDSATVGYTVVAAVTSSVDSDWAVVGTIEITNPAPQPATLVSVADVFDGTTLAVDCGFVFPHILPAGSVLTCTYHGALPGPVNGTNTAEVVTSGPVGGGSATAAVDFGAAQVSLVDDCVDVDDDLRGWLGTVCVADAPRTFTYDLTIGPFSDCAPRGVVNTASFTTDDTGTTASDAWTVAVTLVCDLGCTRTPGYWKTHSHHGPAPFDPTWSALPQGADSPFFLAGASYHKVLWTPPAGGNAYYILAHAYIAAELNQLAGASFGDAAAAFASATPLFQTTTPAQAAGLRGSARARWISLAGTLDAYNNGATGPGHCSN